jgi:hypothetical protein
MRLLAHSAAKAHRINAFLFYRAGFGLDAIPGVINIQQIIKLLTFSIHC